MLYIRRGKGTCKRKLGKTPRTFATFSLGKIGNLRKEESVAKKNELETL
jgi:hypothetical protein